MAEEKKATVGLNTPTVLLIGGAVLLLWDKLFGKSEAEKKEEEEEKKIESLPLEKNPLSTSYTPQKPPAGFILYRSTKTLPAVPANYFSSAVVQIKNAIGTFTDDETAIINAMKRPATKYELALMAKVYAQLYKRDLWFDLKDNLSSKELLTITSYVNKLPQYIKGKQVSK